jgi:hypothetical protein
MAMVDIESHEDIVALGPLNNPLLQINLNRLEELRMATESYNLLRSMVYPRNWSCKKMIVLEELCSLSADLDVIRDHLLPIVVQAQPFPNMGLSNEVAGAVVTMKVKAMAMETAGTAKYIKGLRNRSLICQRIASLGELMASLTRDLLANSETLAIFQDGIEELIARIDEVLDTEIQF